MTVDAGVWIALIGALGGLVGLWVNRNKLKAEVEKVKTDTDSVVLSAVSKATAAMQDTYQALLADVQAHANASAASAKEARTHAQEAENSAWQADMRARAMERFLAELRPLIAAHVPDAEAILERLDKLAPARP